MHNYARCFVWLARSSRRKSHCPCREGRCVTQRSEMRQWLRLSAGVVVVGAWITGCAGGSPQKDPSWKLVPITDVQMVVGEWEGLIKKERATLAEGSVRLIIRANQTYLFAGQTASKVAVGSGDLERQDGRLVGNTDRRAVTFTLYDHKGSPVVLVEATNHETGERYRGELTKVMGPGTGQGGRRDGP